MSDLPERLVQFIEDTPWTFAKTYAKTWPHEYIVREKVDLHLFIELAEHIDKHGYTSTNTGSALREITPRVRKVRYRTA